MLWATLTTVSGQVTIGSNLVPNTGALLDLKDGTENELTTGDATGDSGSHMPKYPYLGWRAKAAASVLSCLPSKRSLQRYRSTGILPFCQIGQKTFYLESDVGIFIQKYIDQKGKNE